MSNARFSIMPSRAVDDNEISDSVFRTLAALGIYGDKNGWCWPSLQTIADLRHKSKPAVSRDIKTLKEKGYLNIEPRYNEETGGQRSNMYQIKFDYPPLTPGVNPPLTSEVNPPLTLDVNHNAPINELSNDLNEILPNGKRNIVSKSGDLVDGILHYSKKGREKREAGKMDMEGWPVDVQDDIQEFARVFKLPIPQSKTGRGDWIQGVRDIRREAQNIPLEAIFKEGKALAEKETWLNGIGRPAALVKSIGRIIRSIQLEQLDVQLSEDGSFYV